MPSKPALSRSIVLALIAASALALGGCAETTSGYGGGYVARAPAAAPGALLSSATLPTVVTTTPQATPPSRSRVSKRAFIFVPQKTASIR
jgi:hypothetical protein